MKYHVVSTDDHIVHAPDSFAKRMSKVKWGDKIPHIERNDKGVDSWVVYGERMPNVLGIAGVNGAMPDRTKSPSRWEDVPPSTYIASERIKAMDQDGVDVHSLFGGNQYAGNRYKDEEFRLDCLKAYNDSQIEDYHQLFPGRFITLAVLPEWDVQKALAELARVQKRGIHAVNFFMPQQFGFPHICEKSWDPLWAAMQEAGLSINFHIGGGASQGAGSEIWSGHTPMFNLAEVSVKAISANTSIMTTLLFSGIMERFPKLKIVSSESGIGWVPYLLEVADHQWERQRLNKEGMDVRPSEYFKRQCYVNFWFEDVGVKMRNYIGLDSIMWESDFPHPTCTWPTSQDYIERSLADVSPAEREQILVGNAVRVFNLEKYQD